MPWHIEEHNQVIGDVGPDIGRISCFWVLGCSDVYWTQLKE
jgi:hypothetical protein